MKFHQGKHKFSNKEWSHSLSKTLLCVSVKSKKFAIARKNKGKIFMKLSQSFYKVWTGMLSILCMLLASSSALQADENVGPLHHVAIVVPDVATAVNQWQAGTGNEFGPITT